LEKSEVLGRTHNERKLHPPPLNGARRYGRTSPPISQGQTEFSLAFTATDLHMIWAVEIPYDMQVS
jgi:hypothetical protein